MGGVSPPFSFGHPDEANWLKCLSPSPCFVDNGWEGKEKDVCASQPASAVPRPPGRRAGRGFPLPAAGGPGGAGDPCPVCRPGGDPGGEGRSLSSVLSARPLPSLIFWGPPGSGKTTLARIIAAETKAVFLPFSAVLAGIKEIKEALAGLKTVRTDTERPAILFIDEIHRFNKAQQDALLPFVEDGTVTLFGTTTENPSFEIRNALLSRCRVLVLDPLSAKDVETIVRRGLTDPERGLAKPGEFLVPDALRHLVEISDGDARVALNALEAAIAIAEHRGLPSVDVGGAEG